MKLRSKKGFSLVELIIVIAILGIIALIAVPNLTTIQKKSQINADIRTAEQIGKAVRIWVTDAGTYDEQRDRETTLKSGVEYGTLENIEQYIPKGKTAIHNDQAFVVKLTDNYITVSIGGITAYSEASSETVSADLFMS